MARVTVQAGAALEVGDGVRAEAVAGAGAIERPIPLAETCVGRLTGNCEQVVAALAKKFGSPPPLLHPSQG